MNRNGVSIRVVMCPTLLLVALAGCDRTPRQQAGARDAASERPNVLLISLDTTRADHLACYGHPSVRTPHIDALAAAGVLFEQCYTCVPVTLPSHASILTGVYPYVHKVRDNGRFRLVDENQTLAEVFRQAGYATGAQVGAFVMHHQYGLDQGFDTYRDVEYRGQALTPGASATEITATEVTDGALALLDDFGQRPFFLFVHYFDPHRPYRAPPEFTRQYLEPYLAEIAYTDQQVGRLLDGLRRRGLLERTLVVLTADHGEGLGQHNEDTHGYFLYDATLHVPLIFSWPGHLAAGRRVAGLVRTIDIAPTIAALARLRFDVPVQGRDLGPWLGLSEPPAAAPAESFYAETFYPKFTYHLGFSQLRAWRHGRWKLIHAPRPELYDVLDDPGELRNLAEQRSELVEQLRSELRQMLAEAPRIASATAARHQIQARELRALEALGYLGGGDDQAPAVSEDELSLFEPIGLNPIDHYEEIRLATQAVDFIEAGQHARTEQALKKLLVQAGDRADQFVWAHAHLAGALAAQGKLAEALEHFDQAVAARPDDGQLHTMRGLVLRALGRKQQALAAFRKAAELPPTFAVTYLNLGRTQAELGRFRQAARSLRKAIELDPRSLPAHVALVGVLGQLGDRAGAMRTLDRAIVLAREQNKPRMVERLTRLRNKLSAPATRPASP